MQNIKSTLSEPEPWGKERGEQDDGGRRAEVCVCVHHLIRSAPGLREGSSRLLPLSSKRAMQIGELDGGEGGVVRLAASPVPARHEPESDTAKGPQHPGRPRGSPRERCSKNGETHAAVPRLFPLRQGVLGGGEGEGAERCGCSIFRSKAGDRGLAQQAPSLHPDASSHRKFLCVLPWETLAAEIAPLRAWRSAVLSATAPSPVDSETAQGFFARHSVARGVRNGHEYRLRTPRSSLAP